MCVCFVRLSDCAIGTKPQSCRCDSIVLPCVSLASWTVCPCSVEREESGVNAQRSNNEDGRMLQTNQHRRFAVERREGRGCVCWLVCVGLLHSSFMSLDCCVDLSFVLLAVFSCRFVLAVP